MLSNGFGRRKEKKRQAEKKDKQAKKIPKREKTSRKKIRDGEMK